VNARGLKILQEAGLKLQKSTFSHIQVADSGTACIEGELHVPFQIGSTTRVIPVLFVPKLNATLLLGIDFSKRFNLRVDFVQETCEVSTVEIGSEGEEDVLNPDQRQRLNELLEEFRPLFDSEKFPCAKGVVHHIDTGDALPVRRRYNAINPRNMEAAHAELDARLKKDIVEPSDSPWCSTLVQLPKKGGGQRWVVDFRQVNQLIKMPNANQLPRINDEFMRINSPTIISSIDIRDAYLNICLDEESKQKTAFYVPGRGLYQFKRLPAGLKDAAGRWQGHIDKIIGYHPYVIKY